MISPLASKRIQQLNDILRQELGTHSGLPRYQWKYSEDLKIPMVILDDQEDPKPIQEQVCQCGVDRVIHTPQCSTFAVVRYKTALRSLVGDRKNQWVLCCHVMPGIDGFPSENDWEEAFSGSFPYPRNGYYIPVSDAQKMITIKTGYMPTFDLTMKIVADIKEQEEMDTARMERDREEAYQAEQVKRKVDYQYALKDAMTMGEGRPGEKTNYIIVP